MEAKATNRQIKVLRFYGVRHPESLSLTDASWEITDLWSSKTRESEWDKYLYLTRDFDNDTDQLKPYTREQLEAVELPTDWERHIEQTAHRKALVDSILAVDPSPFNKPEPPVVFAGRKFVFTGRFEYGTRDNCMYAILARGGTEVADLRPSLEADYLVIGTKGSPQWKHGAYGSKIAAAILERRTNRRIAIVSETHWRAALDAVPPLPDPRGADQA